MYTILIILRLNHQINILILVAFLCQLREGDEGGRPLTNLTSSLQHIIQMDDIGITLKLSDF